MSRLNVYRFTIVSLIHIKVSTTFPAGHHPPTLAVGTGVLPYFHPWARTSCSRSRYERIWSPHRSYKLKLINLVTLLAKGIAHLADRLDNVSRLILLIHATKYWRPPKPTLAIQTLYDLVRRYPPDLSYLTTIHPIFILVRLFHLSPRPSLSYTRQSDLRHNLPLHARPARPLRPHHQHRHFPLRPALQRQPYIPLHRRLCTRRTQAMVRSRGVFRDLREQPRGRAECDPAGGAEEAEVGAVDCVREGQPFWVFVIRRWYWSKFGLWCRLRASRNMHTHSSTGCSRTHRTSPLLAHTHTRKSSSMKSSIGSTSCSLPYASLLALTLISWRT